MNTAQGNPSTAGDWEIFILASCAPLGQFRQVHLAPRFPPGRLNLALRTELPLLDNELLVALIDSDSGGFQSVVVLTSWRVYWSQREGRDGRGGEAPATARPAPAIRTYGIDYGLIPEGIEVHPGRDGSTEITLGGGRSLPLYGAEPRLAEALAAYLRTVGAAARTGIIPRPDERDARLTERIAGVLPRVAEVTARIRTLGRDLHAFRRDLLAATPSSVATTTFTIACVAIYAIMVLSGVEPIIPTTTQLLEWGANNSVRVVLRHEFWRLPASVFIHGGLIHLAVNMWCLYNIGPLVERLFGNLAFAAIYLAAGIGGAIASMATLPPFRVSVGASGAIFGILGALLAFLVLNRHSVPGSVLKPLRSSALSFVIFNTLFGVAVPNIDQAAHMGGLVTGFVGGLLLIRPWPVVRSTGTTLRRLALGTALAGAILGVGIAAIRYREQTLPPDAAFDDFRKQASDAVKEFDEIRRKTPSARELNEAADRPPDRQRLAATLRSLLARASTNRDRLGRVTVFDPDLRAMQQILIDGQGSQAAALAAGVEYLDSGDVTFLSGGQGMDEWLTRTDQRVNEFVARQAAYAQVHGLNATPRDPPGERRAP
jgi:rhomboid protease GluP